MKKLFSPVSRAQRVRTPDFPLLRNGNAFLRLDTEIKELAAAIKQHHTSMMCKNYVSTLLPSSDNLAEQAIYLSDYLTVAGPLATITRIIETIQSGKIPEPTADQIITCFLDDALPHSHAIRSENAIDRTDAPIVSNIHAMLFSSRGLLPLLYNITEATNQNNSEVSKQKTADAQGLKRYRTEANSQTT